MNNAAITAPRDEEIARQAEQQESAPGPARTTAQTFSCALCPVPITVADGIRGALLTVNVGGHARAAHRECPPAEGHADDPADAPTAEETQPH